SISGLTIENGAAGGNGGGIYNTGTLTVSSSIFFDNSADSGGGIYSATSYTVRDSTFSANSANYGGGIYSNLYNVPGSATVSNCVLAGNSATYNGGGIVHFGDTSLLLSNSTFSAHSAGLDA